MSNNDRDERLAEFETMSKTGLPMTVSETDPFNQAIRKILNYQNVILSGPPGTGKSRIVDLLIKGLHEKLDVHQVIQFHPDFAYQDFIEGYKIQDGKYVPDKGLFLRFLEKCEENDKIHLFVIDEINRGDIPAIFGELMYLLDKKDKRTVQTSKFGREVSIPRNVVLLGTMNTADKNIRQIDFALRRRFSFVFVPPDYDGMRTWLNEIGFQFDEFTIDDYVKSAERLNKRILKHPLLGKNMTLGQSLFVPGYIDHNIQLSQLAEHFSESILAQLESYLGLGATKELELLLGNTEIRDSMENGQNISEECMVHTVLGLINAKD